MSITLTPLESAYLANLLISPDNCLPQYDEVSSRLLAKKLLSSLTYDFTSQENRFLQYLLQEQLEVNGSQHSIANEKDLRGPGTKFYPHSTMLLIKSISDKLGAALVVNTITQSDQTTGRQEGSTWIMTDPATKATFG